MRYSQRQQVLDEMERLRAREHDLKRQTDLLQRYALLGSLAGVCVRVCVCVICSFVRHVCVPVARSTFEFDSERLQGKEQQLDRHISQVHRCHWCAATGLPVCYAPTAVSNAY